MDSSNFKENVHIIIVFQSTCIIIYRKDPQPFALVKQQ